MEKRTECVLLWMWKAVNWRAMFLAMGVLSFLVILSLVLYGLAAIPYKWSLRIYLILGALLLLSSGISYLSDASFSSRHFAVAALFVLAIGRIGRVVSDARSERPL